VASALGGLRAELQVARGNITLLSTLVDELEEEGEVL
jgi:hypothetical protein